MAGPDDQADARWTPADDHGHFRRPATERSYVEAPHLASPENVARHPEADRPRLRIRHVFISRRSHPDAYAEQILDWSGGYFDWGNRRRAAVVLGHPDARRECGRRRPPDHPVLNGVAPFTVHEEFLLRPATEQRRRRDRSNLDGRPELPGREPDGAGSWRGARERPNGGARFSARREAHFLRQLGGGRVPPDDPQCARLWTAGLDVPVRRGRLRLLHACRDHRLRCPESTAARAGRAEANQSLDSHRGSASRARLAGHNTGDRRIARNGDVRMQVDVSAANRRPWRLTRLTNTTCWSSNYCKLAAAGAQRGGEAELRQVSAEWRRPWCLFIFSNGAFHYSLPGEEESDWPEYRNICRRVWDHNADSGHDAYGKFIVENRRSRASDHEVA